MSHRVGRFDLNMQHRQRVTGGGMLAQHPDEFSIAARVFMFVRLARGPVGITRRHYRHASVAKALPVSREAAALDDFRIGTGAIAASRRRHRQASTKMMNTNMQRRDAHGMADHMGLADLERIHQGDHVVARGVLAVFAPSFGDIGRRIAALAIGDAAVRREKCRICGSQVRQSPAYSLHEDRRALPASS